MADRLPDVVRRTTLIVRDAEVSARWYQAVFGLTRHMDVPFTLSGEQLAAGSKGDQTRLILMRSRDDGIGMIGLLQWVDPPLAIPPGDPERVDYGRPIFVIAADDVRATVAAAHAEGTRVHCEPRAWSTAGADGTMIGMLGASLFDPDGYFFEVNQRL